MRRKLLPIFLITCIALCIAFSLVLKKIISGRSGSKREPGLNLSLKYEAEHSLQTAVDFLITSQHPNGSWKNDPAITSLVLYSLLLQPSHDLDERVDKAIQTGLDYLKQFVKPDGGIYNQQFKTYPTSVCLLAFTQAGRSEYNTIISNAKDFLIKSQLDEGEGIEKEHAFYGGIGYGGDDRPDLSNTQFALDAIKAAEVYESGGVAIPRSNAHPAVHWRKAIVFLARTQNIKSINLMPYAAGDGGFIYETGHYDEDRSHSYGSMTCAGLKSLLHAGVEKEDIRIEKAFEWISSHYTLEENPAFGTNSVYYYYMTLAKCLDILGEEVITDSRGTRHRWRQDLIEKLISLQHEDGYWVNPNGRYWENIKDLATAYSVIAMKFAIKDTSTNQPKTLL